MATRSFQLAKILGADGDIKADALDSAAISSGVTEYATTAVLPSTGNSFGDQALVTANNRLYIWNGSGWYNIAIVNQNPAFTTSPAASYEFDKDSPRNDITITVAASDPESLGVSFSFETGGSMDSMASVTQDSSVFTLSPKGNADLTDGVTLTGSLTIKASDGVNIVPAVSSFTLTFITIVQNTAETQFLMKASGTGANRSPVDASTSAHTLTVGGTTTQLTTFSPYRFGGYSMLFDGTNDYISYPSNADFALGTGDFTLEAWVYPTTVPGGGVTNDMTLFGHFGSPTMFFFLDNATLAPKLYNGSTTVGSFIGVSDNEWSHIAFSRTSGTLKIFVNGVEGYSASYTFDHTSTSSPYTGKSNAASNRYFHGYIADLRLVKGTGVYPAEFDPTTEKLENVTNTKLLMGAPGFFDLSNSRHLISVSGPEMRGFSPYDRRQYDTDDYGGSASFPGTSDEIKTSDGSTNTIGLGSGDFTVECWIYKNNAASSFWEALISQSYTNTGGWRFYKTDGSGRLRWYAGSTDTLLSDSTNPLITKAWCHAAIVRSSGTLTWYINGKASGSVSSHTYNYTGAGAEIEIGKGTIASALPTDANMTDVRIVNGTAVYTGDFTPPSGPLTTTGGTYPSNTNVNTSITAGHTKLLLNMTQAKIRDVSQSHHTMQIHGNVAASSAVQKFSGENTVAFDGASDYITLEDTNQFGVEDFTVEGWIYPTSLTSTHNVMFSNYNSYGGAGTFAIFVPHSTATTSFSLVNEDGVASGGSLSYNQWYHVAVTRSNNTLRLYVDGTEVANRSHDTHLNGAGTLAYIGESGDIIGSGGFPGSMQDFRITKGRARYPYIAKPVTLTQTNSGMEKPDITFPTATASNTKLLAFTTGTITNDASAGSHTLTAGGSAAASNNAPAREMHSVYIPNGDTDIISIPASADHQIYGGDYTVEAWLYVTSFNSHGYWISKGGNTSREWGFGVTATGLTTYWNTTGSGGAGDSSFSAPATNRTHEWFHVAFTKSSNTLRTFRNGSFCGSGTFTSIYGGNGTIKIGRLMDYTGISHSFNGYISNLRIVKGEALYTNSFTPSTTSLIS